MDLSGRIPGDIGKRVVRLLCSPCLPLHNTHVLGASSVAERANDDCARYGRLTKPGDGLSSNTTNVPHPFYHYHKPQFFLTCTMSPPSTPPPPYSLASPSPPASAVTTFPPLAENAPPAQTFLGIARSKFRTYLKKTVLKVFGGTRGHATRNAR
ncbi:hypothetical protein B0H10DRAFT_2245440 [Mycena sp. CBHHK59/15]|nr:hypothetical protein B0H10DRAFT_2245440 [Mycena sp. CBHHK59/15]